MATYKALSYLEGRDCDDEYGSGHLRRAVELQSELLAIDPTVEPLVVDRRSNPYGILTEDVTLNAGSGPSYRRNLVDLALLQAELLEGCGRLEAADGAYEQIEEKTAELLAANPTIAANVGRAAMAETALAGWSERRGDLDSALAHARRAVEHQERLSSADPSNMPAQDALAAAQKLVERYATSASR